MATAEIVAPSHGDKPPIRVGILTLTGCLSKPTKGGVLATRARWLGSVILHFSDSFGCSNADESVSTWNSPLN
ncbi:hypothetical protein V6N13_021698 [Hibiscus sabdariffa]|uniref:Uncharacterized protein n=1 Tax=Hibiscus sabdariffa TaxID=183260 RepID=A0ABR2BAI9_9ROSI